MTIHLRTSVCAAVLVAAAAAQAPLDPAFQERAMSHVRRLAVPRVAGTEGESKAAAYIAGEMRKAGLKVSVEPFEYQGFELENAVLQAGDVKAAISVLVFNPYAAGGRIAGKIACVQSPDNARELMRMDLDGRIVVIPQDGKVFLPALLKKTLAVAQLSTGDFERIRASGIEAGEIAVRGKATKTASSNIVGTLAGPAGSPEIVVSAHFDSWNGPGASDNATGVAVMLELAGRFSSLKPPLPATLRFVAFGAEESGMVGSRQYLESHAAELGNCRLLFNIDTVGGDGKIYAEIRGGGAAGKVVNRLPASLSGKAMSDPSARWIAITPEMLPLVDGSNAPDWLRAAVTEAAKEAGREVVAANGMGSDHRVFIQAGVVATNIAVEGGKTHSAEDAVENVHPASLEAAARIVAAAVEKAARLEQAGN